MDLSNFFNPIISVFAQILGFTFTVYGFTLTGYQVFTFCLIGSGLICLMKLMK